MSGIADAWLKQLDERTRMTPSQGYNVVLIDEVDYSNPMADRLSLLQHVDTWDEAQKSLKEWQSLMADADIIVYPTFSRANLEVKSDKILTEDQIKGMVDLAVKKGIGSALMQDSKDSEKRKKIDLKYIQPEFNPNHDPDDGKFTSGPGGDSSDSISNKSFQKYKSSALVKGEKPLGYDAALKKHDDFFNSTKLTGYSFDPATGKGYDLTDKSQAQEFYARHGDGEHDVFMVATTNNVGQFSSENHAEYEQVANSGHYPLIGYFKSPNTGKEYRDISFPVDTGIEKGQVDKLLVNYRQESTIRVDKNGDYEFIDASVQNKIDATSSRPLKGEKKIIRQINKDQGRLSSNG